MLTMFALFAIALSPIADEVDAATSACENALAEANADEEAIPAARESCRSACAALATAIEGAGLSDPAPFVGRVLSAWRVLDAAVAVGASGDLSFGGTVVLAADTELRRLRYEVAQQLAYEASLP